MFVQTPVSNQRLELAIFISQLFETSKFRQAQTCKFILLTIERLLTGAHFPTDLFDRNARLCLTQNKGDLFVRKSRLLQAYALPGKKTRIDQIFLT